MIWSCRKKGRACLQWFGHVERREERAYNGLVMQREGRSVLDLVNVQPSTFLLLFPEDNLGKHGVK